MRIGFETYPGEGPGIFLSRLQAVLETRGVFDARNPDVWINLSFKPVPDWILERKQAGRTKLLTRMDGAYCVRQYALRKPFIIPLPVIDNWYSARKNRAKNALIKENLKMADDIIFQSWFSSQVTQKFVIPTGTRPIIYNGADLNHFNPEGPVLDIIDPNRLNILVSHSFRPYHRLHDQFRILAKLKKQRPDAFLNILGGGDAASIAYARQVAGDLKLAEGQDYAFMGKLPPEDLPAVYRSSDLMLNLSYWDACPNVVIEAMASGLPVVGTWYGGVAELVDQAGVLVPENIPFTWLPHKDFARMPQAPADKYVDAIQKTAKDKLFYALKARERAEAAFNIEHTATRYILVAEKAMNKQPSVAATPPG